MSTNSSSISSLHRPLGEYKRCTFVFTALFICYILLLPLFILVIYVGYQQWRKQRSIATAAKTSHADIFTFNMVVLELFGLMGFCVYCYGVYANQTTVLMLAMQVFLLTTTAQNLFHLLTCVERYLAVVHPITYMGLRQASGVRIRNISIGCVWVLSFVSLGLMKLNGYVTIIYSFLFSLFSLTVVSFCSLSVLCVLIRPGPGEVGGNRAWVDQSKQRAFFTIMVIMGALLLRFLNSLINTSLYVSAAFSDSVLCLVGVSAAWFNLPSSLVLPLLFLHRAGKLPGCKRR